MDFNEKLQSLRKSNRITQEELAEKLEVTRQTISKWECGESTPDFRNLVKISEIFKVSIDCLLKDEDPQEDPGTYPTNAPEAYIIKRKLDNKSLLGACLFGTGIISMLVFFILSIVCPMSVLNDYGTFDGMLGFLVFHRIVWVFIAVCLMSVVGLVLLLLPIIKEKKENKNSIM